MGHGKKRIAYDEFLIFRARHGDAQGIRPMLRTLKSNSPFSAPRDDTARASCGNEAKGNSCYEVGQAWARNFPLGFVCFSDRLGLLFRVNGFRGGLWVTPNVFLAG